MKARIAFYCAAAVALVLFLAATSHATERRDPILNPEQIQAAAAHASDSAKSTHARHVKKTAHPPAKSQQTQAKTTEKKTPGSGAGTAGNGK